MKKNEHLDSKPKSRWDMYFQAGGLIVAILAVIITIVFSIRSEHKKEISITYLSKRPLVTLEPGRPSTGVEVTIGGARINSPWLVSGKIENSGNQPIEARDIEEHPKFQFEKAKIVGAEIVGKSQEGISANIVLIGNSVVIQHKLLNPGDWITFDMLFEGEPELPPSLSLRVSGVTKPTQNIVSPSGKQSYLSWTPLPRPVLYFMLTALSLLSVISSGVGLGFLGAFVFEQFSARPHIMSDEEAAERPISDWIVKSIDAESRDGRIVYAALRNIITLEQLDQPELVKAAIDLHVPPLVLQGLQLNSEDAAQVVILELKNSLKKKLADTIWKWSDGEKESKQELLDINAATLSIKEITQKANRLRAESAKKRFGLPSISMTQIMAGSTLFLFGVSLMLILGGTWRNLLEI